MLGWESIKTAVLREKIPWAETPGTSVWAAEVKIGDLTLHGEGSDSRNNAKVWGAEVV